MSLNRMPQWAPTLRGQGGPNSYFSRDTTLNISHSTYQLDCMWLIDPVHKNHPYILDWYYTSGHHHYTTVNPQDIESGPVDNLEESMPNVWDPPDLCRNQVPYDRIGEAFLKTGLRVI